MTTDQEAYDELLCYTLARGDPSFVHQHAVDVWAAQTAGDSDKPIKLTFALVGLYLHLEKGFTGKQVQRAHMKLARRKRAWPTFVLPEERGDVRVHDVVAVPAGPERDALMDQWCVSVWEAYRDNRPVIVKLLRENGIC